MGARTRGRGRTALLAGLFLVAGPVGCGGRTETVAVVPPLSPVPIWCYATLAQTDCYGEPPPPGTGRLVGAYVIERR